MLKFRVQPQDGCPPRGSMHFCALRKNNFHINVQGQIISFLSSYYLALALFTFSLCLASWEHMCFVWRCRVCLERLKWRAGREAPTSLMRAMKRFPKRQGLCRLHCNELTVICWDCCTATATTCTASYMSAASVCKPMHRGAKLTWRTEHGKSSWNGSTDQLAIREI